MIEIVLFFAVYFFMAFGIDNMAHHHKRVGALQIGASVACAYVLATLLLATYG